MSRKYFGTDGVRGRIGVAPMLPDLIVKLGFVAGEVLVAQHTHGNTAPTVIIGKDPRLSGYMLESALEAGFAAAGVNVLLTGPLPTPGISYLTRALRLQAGVVISASHNPYYDNGIKFFDHQGLKLPDATEALIESKLEAPIVIKAADKVGRARRIDDAQGRYIEFCKSRFPSDLSLRGLTIVADAANGGGYKTLPDVFHELGAKVISIGVSPDGLNINKEVGATHPETLKKAVLQHHADIGIAIDGDGDRICLCDDKGSIYDGDDVLFMLAVSRFPLLAPSTKTKKHEGAAQTNAAKGVVGTLMTNVGLELAFAKRGIAFERTQVGDRYILERLQQRGWELGAEPSGHVLMLDLHQTGDGTLAALQVLARMVREGRSLRDLAGYGDTQFEKGWHRMPQSLINARTHRGFRWESDETVQAIVKKAEHKLKNKGRILIRTSGTESVIRVLVEADDEALTRQLAEEVADCIQKQGTH